MCPSGGMARGGPGGHVHPNGAPRPIALAGILNATVQAQPPIRWGSNRTLPDNRFRTRRKGAAEAAPFLDITLRVAQSSSHDTEALSAAGAVRRRSARTPRLATVWTVESRMARSRLTDQFST